MKKLKELIKKPLFIISVIAVVFLLAWFFYSRRKQPYLNNGRSDWAGETDFPDKLAFETAKPSGLKVGDKIKIEQVSNNLTKDAIGGEKVVLEVMLPSQTYHKAHWFVVDHPAVSDPFKTPGTYQKV